MKYYGILLVAILLLLAACDIQPPVMPKWDVDLAVPLINEKYYVSDLVDSVNIFSDANNVVYVRSNGEVKTPRFGNVPFTPPTTAHVDNVSIPNIGTITPPPMPFEDATGRVQFDYAKVTSGTIKTKFIKLVSDDATVSILFNDIYTANNERLLITASQSPDMGWVTFNLAGCHIGIVDSDTPITALAFTATAHSSAATGTLLGHFSLDATAPMAFEEIQGRITNFTMALEDNLGSIDIEYPQNLNDSVTLAGATVNIDLENSVGFNAIFTGQFYAYNAEGDEVTVPIKDDAGQNFIVTPGSNTFTISHSISDLLSIMPTHIEIINGSFSIYSGAELGSVRADDFIDLSYIIEAPLTFTLHENEITVQKEVDIPIAAKNAERVNKNAMGATLHMLILNKVPIGATATAYFSNEPNIDVAAPATYDYSKSATIQSSDVSPGEQTVDITLNEAEIKLFGNPHVYLRWKFSLLESGTPVTIHSSTADYIQIKSMLYAKVAVEEL